MIDTHTHLYDEAFAGDTDNDSGCEKENTGKSDDSYGNTLQPIGAKAVVRALGAGIRHMIFPNVDLSSAGPILNLHKSFPEVTSVAAGLHPTEVTDNWRQDLDGIIEKFSDGSPRIVAIGEIGIDLYWDASKRELQKQCFEHQCRMATEIGLPVIIHCRDGIAEAIETVKKISGIRGVFHCFTGSPEDVRAIRRAGDFYFGIGGVVTFKKAALGDTVREIGIDRILLETDSPYLAPTPYRGKRNESAFLPLIRDKVASELGLAPQEVSDITDRNAALLFRLP